MIIAETVGRFCYRPVISVFGIPYLCSILVVETSAYIEFIVELVHFGDGFVPVITEAIFIAAGTNLVAVSLLDFAEQVLIGWKGVRVFLHSADSILTAQVAGYLVLLYREGIRGIAYDIKSTVLPLARGDLEYPAGPFIRRPGTIGIGNLGRGVTIIYFTPCNRCNESRRFGIFLVGDNRLPGFSIVAPDFTTRRFQDTSLQSG